MLLVYTLTVHSHTHLLSPTDLMRSVVNMFQVRLNLQVNNYSFQPKSICVNPGQCAASTNTGHSDQCFVPAPN